MTKETKKSETKLLKNTEAKKLGKSTTKSLKSAATKKLGVSKTRAKKIKHSYPVKNAENALLLKLKDGDVVIEMFPEDAPNHVARIKELVRAGFYNGLKFHRVIDGFMAQTGCPYGTGTGGSGKKLKAEAPCCRTLPTASFLFVLTTATGWTVNIPFGDRLPPEWSMSTPSSAATVRTEPSAILTKSSA